MSSYAPLFVNLNPGGMRWESDLIGYDALTSYGSPRDKLTLNVAITGVSTVGKQATLTPLTGKKTWRDKHNCES
jgi:hypothetical protein